MTRIRLTGPWARGLTLICLALLCLITLNACDPPPDPENGPENGPGSEPKNTGGTDDSAASGTARTGFAGLGEAVDGFAHALPGTTLSFPDDHGPHPDFRIEWWYLTANLQDEHGEPLGMQWTLFRQAQRPRTDDARAALSEAETSPWATDQLWMAHMALSRGANHHVAERFARGNGVSQSDAASQAGVTAQPFRAWLDDWKLESLAKSASGDALDHLRLTAQAEDGSGAFGYRLELAAEGPLVRHGDQGFSQKSADGQGSMYYSQPFYRVSGEVLLDGENIAVSGRAWLDREWSSQLLDARQTGWDWFSLHLDSGARLMAFRLRGGGADSGDYLSGSWIAPDGEVTPLHGTGLALTPLESAEAAGHRVPVRWRLTLPEKNLELEIKARHANRWMATSVPYWEGAVNIRDAASGEERGQGYLEMTGY